MSIDSLELRRQLGEITTSEVSEVNRVLGGNPITGYMLTSSTKEPARLLAWNKLEGLIFLGTGGGLAMYGRFARGYNNLWLLAAGLPFCTWALCQRSR